MKGLDRQEVEAWAGYVRTREKLERLIEDLAPKTLDELQRLLSERDAWAGIPREQTARLYRRGKEKKIAYPTQKTVQARFLVRAPILGNDSAYSSSVVSTGPISLLRLAATACRHYWPGRPRVPRS